MAQQLHTLVVLNQLEERQLRRLGAAVAWLWDRLPPDAQELILDQSSAIGISGERTTPETLKRQICSFLEEWAATNS